MKGAGFWFSFSFFQQSGEGGRESHMERREGKGRPGRTTEGRNLNSFPRCGLRAGLEKPASELLHTGTQWHLYASA